jgi:NADH dehydrogenase FAD-containing subunit
MGKRLLIVGGGAGGAGSAAKAKRMDPDLEITLFQSGEHVAYAS